MTSWTTGDERMFLRALGLWSSRMKRPVSNSERKVLLARYLVAAEHRTDWGTIDRQEAVDFAQERLEALTEVYEPAQV